MRAVLYAVVAITAAGVGVAQQLVWAPPDGVHSTAGVARGGGAQFPHERHERLFPTCTVCHAGVGAAEGAVYPSPTLCNACHDGSIVRRVQWTPPAERRRPNLRFAHETHEQRIAALGAGAFDCGTCHTAQGAGRMAVERVDLGRCLGCHAGGAAHLEAPDAACATCHLPLASAERLTREDVAQFPAPPSHRDAAWGVAGAHGRQAATALASCAMCHARDFCTQCHVDGNQRIAIQALEPDARALAIRASLTAPVSHREEAFLARHGALKRASPETCRTCHVRESCLSCHTATPAVTDGLLSQAAASAPGARLARTPPPSHAGGFRTRHAGVAARSPETCATCHVRQDCLECHRPGAANPPAYHPADFLSSHPAAAYARETSCSDCHNTAQFCSDCHRAAGLVAQGRLRPGFHDAKLSFIAGHGQAARQSLESCVACHAERDCLTCHSAQGARRFNPHGPGFDPERLKRKNAIQCTACHGTAVPDRP